MHAWWKQVLIVAAGLFVFAGTAQAEKRVALVIGNSAYQHAAALKNPRSDAQDMVIVLKRLGFEVIAGYDLDDRGMSQKVRDFARSLDGAEVGLFFYAGHGMQAKGQNYLLPVNAALKAESDLDFESVALDLVMKQMQRSARMSLVFLDACRDNPLTRSLRASSRSAGIGQGLARIEDATGMMISFSTQPGNVALDGDGRNSPFTKALLNNIETPGMTIGDMMIDVRKQVIAATSERQIPWENSSLTGRFYFKPGEQTASVSASKPEAAVGEPAKQIVGAHSSDDDRTFWTSIADLNDAALYREYLRRFPGGLYVSIAEAKLNALSAGPGKVAMVTTGSVDAGRGVESPRQVAEEMQRELKRIGCYSGTVDGSWGASSRKAMERFNEETKLALATDQPNSQGVAKVKSFASVVCERTQQDARQQQPQRRGGGGEQQGGSGNAAVRELGGALGGYIGSKLRR